MPIKPNQIQLELKNIAKQPFVRICKILPQFEFADGHRTEKQIGLNYECLAEANEYEKFLVKVQDLTPVIPPEQLAESTEPIYVTFSDFVGRLYFSNQSKTWEITAKASKAQLYKQPAKG